MNLQGKSPYFKGKISMNKSSLKIFKCSKDKSSRKKKSQIFREKPPMNKSS